ncbi:MAG TPA: CGNR zinc finger domain-containing protein [Streptosporangiaceae bacterium]
MTLDGATPIGVTPDDVTPDEVTLPSWVPDIEDKPAPMPLLVVQSFVNTLDADNHTDRLARDDDARAWLAEAGLPYANGDLNLVREVRESIRALIGRDPLTPDELRPLETVLASAQPRLEVTRHGQVRLAPAGTVTSSVADGLMHLLLIIRDAQADGTWDRLKLCGNPDCRWAFYDRSHSRRGAWCDMATCGNRIKNRNLRARRRPPP